MSYSTNYTDEYGHTREVSITEEDSAEALKNDYQEIVRKYNPKYVTTQRRQTWLNIKLQKQMNIIHMNFRHIMSVN